MDFMAYPHVEKRGHLEVEDLELGMVYVFPKIDGTNSSIWSKHPGLGAGSRKRELGDGADNAGFRAWLYEQEDSAALACVDLITQNPWLRFFGEWLVPHTFKGYRDEAWRHFYVFDIYDHNEADFLPYTGLQRLCDDWGIDYIPPLAIIDHPTEEQLLGLLDQNTYLCADGAGPGEGLVLKRYGFRNRFGRVSWAKMVRAEFKDRHKRVMPVRPSQGAMTVERDAAERYCTEAFVGKERSKLHHILLLDHFGPVGYGEMDLLGEPAQEYLCGRECRKVLIPRLLQTCFYELVREHAWDFGGKPGATVDFNLLRRMVQARVKAFCEDLF